MSASARSKHPRAETESAGSDARGLSVSTTTAAGSPSAKPPPGKRAKDAFPSSSSDDDDDAFPGAATEPEEGPATSSDDDEDDEGRGVEGLAKRTAQKLGRSGSSTLKAADKRARFSARYAGKSNEEVLESLMKGWRSKYYKHFHDPKIVKVTKGDGQTAIMHRFVCKRYPSKHVDRGDYEDSTSNLKRHVEGCDPADTAEVEVITAYAHGVNYSAARFRFLLAMWCARRHRPFRLIEDPELCAILRMLYDKIDIPSRWTISRDVRLLEADSRARVIVYLRNLPGKVHLCVDGWNVISFLGITVHWFFDGVVWHIILDFLRLFQAHTGAYLAEMLAACLKSYGIEDKVLAITCDNAENNTTMMKHLEALVPSIRGTTVRVRCLAHIMNLVVKAILSQFDAERRRRRRNTAVQADEPADAAIAALEDEDDLDEDDEEDAEDGLETDVARDAADEDDIDEYEDQEEEAITPAEAREGHIAIKKVTQLSKKVWNSPAVRGELARLAKEAGLSTTVLIRPVKTRWNTMTEVLKRVLDMREVLGHLCNTMAFNKPQGVRLRRFELSDTEWKIISQLHELLEPFLYATNEISKSGRALVHGVIPYIDVLTEHVDRVHKDPKLAPSVRAAAKRGRAMLDKYYSYTDDSIIYRIAMILHPRYKKEYFRRLEWPAEWIDAAVELVRDEWNTSYKPEAEAPAASRATGASKGRRSAQASAGEPPATSSAARDLFASINAGPAAEDVDALEAYLSSPPLSNVKDPLAHWEVVYKSASNADAPRPGEQALARMALDFLSAQAASTDAERGFSRGGLTVSKYRHGLADDSVRASTLLGSWANVDALVPEGAAVETLRASMRKQDTGAHPEDDDANASQNAGSSSAAAPVKSAKAKAKTARNKDAGTSSASVSSKKGKGVAKAKVIELD